MAWVIFTPLLTALFPKNESGSQPTTQESVASSVGDGSITVESSIPLLKRQQIYIQVMQAAIKAREDADKKYPDLSNKATWKNYSTLKSKLEEKYQAALEKKLNLPHDKIENIWLEGASQKWPSTPDAVKVVAIDPNTGQQVEQFVAADHAATPDNGDLDNLSAPIIVAARNYVKDRLVSPSSANFGWPDSTNVRYEGNGIYWANGEVESKNAYGVLIKAVYHVKMKHTGGKSPSDFTLEDIELLQ